MKKINKLGQLLLAAYFIIYMATGAAALSLCDSGCDGRCHGKTVGMIQPHHGMDVPAGDCCSQTTPKKTASHSCCDFQAQTPLTPTIPAMAGAHIFSHNLSAVVGAFFETGIENDHLDTKRKHFVSETPLHTTAIYILKHSFLC